MFREPSLETISSVGLGQQDEQFEDVRHPQTILTRATNFLAGRVLTDVTLVAGEISLPCHRLILAANSDYFSAMFTGGMLEQNMETVEIQGVEGGALRQLVDYCYTGKLSLQEDSVENITVAACLLQLPAVI